MSTLANRKIVLVITGGVAAYKGLELLRLFKNQQAQIEVVLSRHALEFIQPLSVQALNGKMPYIDEFDPQSQDGMDHIQLARFADCIVIAPATANTLAQLAQGAATDLIGTLCLASRAPLFIAPAMNQAMWLAAATQNNVDCLRQRNVKVIGPAEGEQACGDVGFGRLVEPAEIIKTVAQHFSATDLVGKQVLITAGPTQEALDPIRYLSNHSSGKMGYALAQAAFLRGAHVKIISGPVHIQAPQGVEVKYVKTAIEMQQAVHEHHCDIFIAAAAVADYRPVDCSEQKIKKNQERLRLEFIRNPDILHSVAIREDRPFCVGFAAETTELINNAKQKLQNKQLDLIIANEINTEHLVFGSDENKVTIISRDNLIELERQSKQQISDIIMKTIAEQYLRSKHHV